MATEYTINQIVKSDVLCDEDYVLATDYAAIEARLASLDQRFMILQGSHDLLAKERDELKRRTWGIIRHIETADTIDLHACIAIAEGGDNG